MRLHTTIVLLIFFTPLASRADLRDSIRYYLKHSKPTLIGGASARNTFIGNEKTKVTGISAGVDYGEKISFTVGVYNLSHPLITQKTINQNTPSQYIAKEISRFWYFGLTGDYLFLKKNRWALDVPLRIGVGSANIELRKTDKSNALIQETTHSIFPVETGLYAQYKIAWWLGLGAGLGTRVVIGKGMSQKFSGTYYNVGLTAFFGSVYNHIREDMRKNPVRPN